jgi:dual specificity tyrosine-phosphorylation-regulated kinase 2/3/4
VLQCSDYKTGAKVAIKMLRDRPKIHSQIVLELDLLVRLQGGEGEHNIIRYIDNFTFRGFFCIVMELLWMDVYTVLKGQRYVAFPMSTVQIVARDTAKALCFIHGCGIIHCDIKPENLVFTSRARKHVKVIDYGCSCFAGKTLYSYIQSRYYRAPEVVLGLEYGKEIDIWSLACVLCEMLTGSPLFSAEDEGQLMEMIVRMRGLPPLALISRAPRAKYYFDEAGQLKPRNDRRGLGISVTDISKITDPGLLDLLDKCLRWVPAERLTAEQFLAHPWVQQAVEIHEPPQSAR